MFRKTNIGSLIFFVLNLALIIYVFAQFNLGVLGWIILTSAYIVLTALMLSSVGEWMMCLVMGAKEIRRRDMKMKIVPIVEVVLDAACKESFGVPKFVTLKMIDDDVPKAITVGRHTICITSGLLNLPDYLIMGEIAHAVGHLANHDSEVDLVIGGGNIFITLLIGIIKLMSLIITGFMAVVTLLSENKAFGAVLTLVVAIYSAAIILWMKIALFFLNLSRRKSEYDADMFALKIGFGNELAAFIDMYAEKPSNKLIQYLWSATPHKDNRVAELQMHGAEYRRSYL